MQTFESLCRLSVPEIIGIDQYLLKFCKNIAVVLIFLNHSTY